MLHRSIIFIHTAFLVLSAALAFLAVQQVQEVTPDDRGTVLWVRDSDRTISSEEFTSEVEAFSEERQVNIALETPDLRDPGGLRHLYVAVGDTNLPGGSWIDEGFADFSPDFQTDVHSFSSLTHLDPRGFYYVFGPPEEAEAFREHLSGLGLYGFVAEEDQVVGWLHIVQGRTLLATLTIAALSGVVAVGSGVFLNARSYAVLRLQGMSLPQILARDFAQLAKHWLPAAAMAATGTTAFLYFYNGLAQFPLFIKVALSYVTVFAVVGLSTHAAALTLIQRTNILAALKGRMPTRLAAISAYGARIPAMALVLSFLASAMFSFGQLQELGAGHKEFVEAGDTSRLHFDGSVSELQDQEKSESIGEWLRQVDSAGQVIVTSLEPGERILPSGAERTDYDMLLVNDTYLETHDIKAPDGGHHGAAENSDQVRLLVPETLRDQEQRLLEGANDWLYEFQGRDNPDLDVDIEVLPTQSGQSMFTYGASRSAPLVHDPVVVAVPNGSDVLHPGSYYAYATNGSLVFPDPQDVFDSMDNSALATYLNGVQPVAQEYADLYKDLVRQLRLESFNLAAGILVLTITGISVCIIHSRANAQTIFARHISGWRFLTAHRAILMIEALLTVAFTGWVVRNTAVALAAFRDPEQPFLRNTTPEIVALEPFLAAGISTLSVGLVLATLTYFHRRIVREGASGS